MTLEKFEASEGHGREREKKADAKREEREKVAGIISVRQPRDLCTCTHFFPRPFSSFESRQIGLFYVPLLPR